MPKSVIYGITNVFNDKVYVGSSSNFKRRVMEHKRKLRSETHDNKHLQNAWRKYGEDSFEFSVIEVVSNNINLLMREQWFLDNVVRWKYDYNIARVADCPPKVSGKHHPFFGKHHSEETKKKISRSGSEHNFFGKHHSEETKKKISNSTKGEKHKFFGKKHLEKTKRKMMGENNYSSKTSEEDVLEIRRKYDTGKYFYRELGKMFDLSTTQISRIVKRESWGYI